MPDNKEQLMLFPIRDLRHKEKFIVDDIYLNGYARLCGIYATGVYISLCRHVNKEQKCWPGIKKISEELGISQASVKRGIKKLKEYKIIKVDTLLGKKLTNRYYLIDRSGWSHRLTTGSSHRATRKLSQSYHQGSHRATHSKETHSKETQEKGLSAKADEMKELTNKYINSNKRKDIRIILLFARAKEKKEWSAAEESSFIKRNLRAAKLLEPYSYERIIEVMDWLNKNADFKWTLETCSKYIDEDLKKLTKAPNYVVIN